MNKWVLMAAMPPTKGHLNLIRFAEALPGDFTKVIVCTQPGEPRPIERVAAVRASTNVEVIWHHQEQEQDPSAPGFWQMWDSIMLGYGAKHGDIYVSSEPYGAQLAERMSGQFIPYDPNRELYYTKATRIREQPERYFHDILPEFQRHVRTTVTVFGAESTGKTTLSKALAYELNAHWLFEWARPYLELVGPEIHRHAMDTIYKGQYALQDSSRHLEDKPFIVQDTDLFSTIGYWEQPHWSQLGPVPLRLVADAEHLKSDLYIITRSNIPFEEDPIRYGGDRRESSDDYWISVAEKYNLPYVVLDETDPEERLTAAAVSARLAFRTKANLAYDRKGL